jgi:hypothetical protein
MKYIIKESAAKQLSFEGIKDVINELGLERREFDSFILYSMTNEDDLGYDPVVIEFDSEDGRLYVQIKYFENILNLFGYNTTEEQEKIFSDWLKYYEDIKPDYVEF